MTPIMNIGDSPPLVRPKGMFIMGVFIIGVYPYTLIMNMFIVQVICSLCWYHEVIRASESLEIATEMVPTVTALHSLMIYMKELLSTIPVWGEGCHL